MIVQPRGGAEREPAVLRLPVGIDTDVALQVIAGTGDPPALEAALARAVRKRLSVALELTRGRVYLAGWRALTRAPWGERALALAELASAASQVTPTCFGSPPPDWAGIRVGAVPLPQDPCPVCYEDFSDPLPTPDPESRAPVGRWLHPCPHALCRGCDERIQPLVNNSCPECRAMRVVTLAP